MLVGEAANEHIGFDSLRKRKARSRMHESRASRRKVVDGGNAEKVVSVTSVVSGGKVIFSFDYALGHKYALDMSPGEIYDFDLRVGISQTVTGGSDETYDGYTVFGLMYATVDEIELEAYAV